LQRRPTTRVSEIAKLQFYDCISIDQLTPGDFDPRSSEPFSPGLVPHLGRPNARTFITPRIFHHFRVLAARLHRKRPKRCRFYGIIVGDVVNVVVVGNIDVGTTDVVNVVVVGNIDVGTTDVNVDTDVNVNVDAEAVDVNVDVDVNVNVDAEAVNVNVDVVVVDVAVVDDAVVGFVGVGVLAPEAAAVDLSLAVSISVTTGGVTAANLPHCSKKARLSALSLSSSRTSLLTGMLPSALSSASRPAGLRPVTL
jgi:hypothetical protein